MRRIMLNECRWHSREMKKAQEAYASSLSQEELMKYLGYSMSVRSILNVMFFLELINSRWLSSLEKLLVSEL